MGYNSTIARKKCKCGCEKYPTLGYNGFFSAHAPQEVKDRVGTKRDATNKSRNARNKVRGLISYQEEAGSVSKITMNQWFFERRKELTGVCQCGCGNKSQKNNDTYFRHSCCHIFPKSKFQSVATHPLNCIERAFFGGCHSVLDDTSMDRWVNMADWSDIKERFYVLAPLLTREEQASKFYYHLERLVYSDK